MKNKILWYSAFILSWLIFMAASTILAWNCIPSLMINELNIAQKTMMVFGFISCEYGWILILEAMVAWVKRRMRDATKE